MSRPDRNIGYGRVSTDDQHLSVQRHALEAVPCDLLFLEHGSGADRTRPELARALKALRTGDVLIVQRLDRLGRSLLHLLQIIEDLEGRGVAFRSLAEGIDMRTAEGRLMMQQLGAFAEFERKRIIARVESGISAAKRRGVVFGNPGLLAGDKATIKKLAAGRRNAHCRKLVEQMENFMPTVRRLRPHTPWPEVARLLTAETGEEWSEQRLVRSVRRLAAEGMGFVDPALLKAAPRPRRRRSDELAAMIRGMRLLQPEISLRAIADQLKTMGVKTPRGSTTWSPSSVAKMLNKTPPISAH
jgi:DNA invertase Pin-like site-specific DNA recombinase